MKNINSVTKSGAMDTGDLDRSESTPLLGVSKGPLSAEVGETSSTPRKSSSLPARLRNFFLFGNSATIHARSSSASAASCSSNTIKSRFSFSTSSTKPATPEAQVKPETGLVSAAVETSASLQDLIAQRKAAMSRLIRDKSADGTFNPAETGKLLAQLDAVCRRNRASTNVKKNFKALEKDLIKLTADVVKIPGKKENPDMLMAAAKKMYRNAIVAMLNEAPWNAIRRSCTHGDTTYNSTLTPAGQLKLGDKSIFKSDYNDKGVASGSTTNITHATNLYTSEFGADGTLYKGVRHGICSPYGLRNGSPERTEGARERAREVVTAALLIHLGKEGLADALSQGAPVHLNLTSISLVTPFNFRGQTEGEQIADQMAAWEHLGNNQPLLLEITNENGELKQLPVNLKVAAFNMGVNEVALKLGIGNFKPGAQTSDNFNSKAMHTLLGEKFLAQPDNPEAVGGMLAAYLNTVPAPANAAAVLGLATQACTIFNSKLHRKDDGDPYKLARCIALLSNEINVVPCSNCKSGKDRTGALDAEIKKALVVKHQNNGVYRLPGGNLSVDDKALLAKMFLESGNMEVQKQNTGAAGNKVFKGYKKFGLNLSLAERVGSAEVFRDAQGWSGLVKS